MKKPYLAGIVLIALTASIAFAQSGEDIVNKHLQAVGGAAKLKAINSIKSTGSFSMPTFGLEMNYTMLQKRGDKMIIRMTSEQMGSMIQATDGKMFWTVNPFMGALEPTEMSADDAKDFKRQANIDGFVVNRDKSGIKLESMGQAELGGVNYNKVKVIYPDGFEQLAYFDIDTGLLITMESVVTQQGQTITMTTLLSDYRETDGILIPHRIENTSPQMNMVITIETVEYNVPIDDGEFKMPEPAAKK